MTATSTATAAEPRRYALRDEQTGGVWYYLPDTVKWSGWDGTVTDVRPDPADVDVTAGQRPGWWHATAPLPAVTVVTRGPAPVVAYRLRDDCRDGLYDALPETLPPDEYREAAETWMERDLASGRALVYRDAYDAVRGDPPLHEQHIDLTGCLALDGHPPPHLPDGAAWQARLPAELREHPEYLHLFPGELHGFRKAVTAALNALDGVDAYDQSDWTVYVKRGRTRELVAAGLVSPPPLRIAGDTAAAAVAEWNRRIAVYVDTVEQAAASRPCPRCDGTGVAWDVGPADEAVAQRLAARFVKAAGRSRAARDYAGTFARIAVEELRGMVADREPSDEPASRG